MKHLICAALLAALPALSAPALAEGDPVTERVVHDLILPRFDAFATAAHALNEAAEADCTAASPALRDRWNAAFDAWIPASAFRFGPLEQDGRGLAIAFWPDPKGMMPKALAALTADEGAALAATADYAASSVAARGLHAIEAMLYDPALNGYAEGEAGCTLVRAAAADLAATAAAVAADWHDDFAPLLLTAGAPGNSRFLSPREVRQAIFTQLATDLAFAEETRLARPLGTPDRPRPARAESRLSGRSLHNIRAALTADRALAEALSEGGTETLFPAFDYAQSVAGTLEDPVFAGVETPSGRFRVQELADAIHRIRETAMAELGAELGVSAGFNALDGD